MVSNYLFPVIALPICTSKPLISEKPHNVSEDVETLIMDQIEVNEYVGGLVKPFERKVASKDGVIFSLNLWRWRKSTHPEVPLQVGERRNDKSVRTFARLSWDISHTH